VRVCIVTTSYPRYPDDVSETTTGAPIRHLVAQERMEVTVLAPGDAGAAAREQSPDPDASPDAADGATLPVILPALDEEQSRPPHE